MVITKFLAQSCVLSEMKATNKPDAIKELTHLLFDKKKMKNIAPALDQIVAREATESTGFGHGIAVPHARIPGMKTLACAVGRIPEGLDFLAVDRKPVFFIFLICYPPNQQTTYLNFVATVAKLLGNNEGLKTVLEAAGSSEIYEALENMSEIFAKSHDEEMEKFKADPAIARVRDSHADLILLARLQLQLEMIAVAKTGKRRINEQINGIRAMVEPRILAHFDRLMDSRAPALVPVEGDTCQGCFIKLPSKFVQKVRQDAEHICTCVNCSRYIYVV